MEKIKKAVGVFIIEIGFTMLSVGMLIAVAES
jgi:hypothetical protein